MGLCWLLALREHTTPSAPTQLRDAELTFFGRGRVPMRVQVGTIRRPHTKNSDAACTLYLSNLSFRRKHEWWDGTLWGCIGDAWGHMAASPWKIGGSMTQGSEARSSRLPPSPGAAKLQAAHRFPNVPPALPQQGLGFRVEREACCCREGLGFLLSGSGFQVAWGYATSQLVPSRPAWNQ